jgi:hypothetical protein
LHSFFVKIILLRRKNGLPGPPAQLAKPPSGHMTQGVKTMPKPFKLYVEVEELYAGRVMRALNNMEGVAKVVMDLESERKDGKPNGSGQPRGPYKPRKTFETTGADFVMELLHKEPMPTQVLRDHFNDVGRSPHSISSQLHTLQNDDLIKHTADGTMWMLTKKAKDRMRHRKPKGK